MEKTFSVFKKIQNAVNVLTGIMLLATIVIIVAQTFMRYVVFHSIPWSEEASRFMFVLIIVLTFNVAISKDMLVNINIIDNILGANHPVMKYLEIFRLLVGLFVEVFFFLSSIQLVGIGSYQLSPAMQFKMTYMYIPVAIGFFLSIIAVILKICEKIMSFRKEGAER